VGKMVLGLSDLKVLVEIADKTSSWLGQVIDHSKNKKEQQAARLLATAGILVTSMRTLDNSLRAVMRELNLFTTEWPQERRDQLIKSINEFANNEQILPAIRQYYEQLGSLLYEEQAEDQADAQEVLECARGILAAMGESVVTPFPDTNALRTFLDLIKRANTSEEVLSAVEQSETVLEVVGRNVLARADLAFGRLKGQILRRHRGLLDPGWSVALVAK
jgi:hypothetical protein